MKSQKTASDASWSRSVMNKSHIAAFQSLICGIRTYVKLGNTEVGLHRAQLPCFIFKKHSQLLQASSAGVQGEMTRGWLLSTEDPLPFNSLKKKWAGKNGRSVKKVRANHDECYDECQSGPLPDKVNASSLVQNVNIKNYNSCWTLLKHKVEVHH